MAPKQLNGKGRTVAEPSFAQSTIQGLTSAENRSVVTAIGLFAVSLPRIQDEDDEMRISRRLCASRLRIPHIQGRRCAEAPASRARSVRRRAMVETEEHR